jgi:thiol:disulfide interchange protein DsbG
MPMRLYLFIAFFLALIGTSLGVPAKDWPAPIKALEAQGIEVIGSFNAPGGLTGYAAVLQHQPISLYLTADGTHVMVGPMFDAKGNNVSEEPLDRLVSKPLTDRVWRQLESSTWIADGSKKAPRVVYVFTDPNCPFCNKFWNEARPWVKADKVQLRHVMVGILGPTSPGKAAALLAAKDPAVALSQHELQQTSGGLKPLSPIPAEVHARLDANEKMMAQLGSSATPTIFYKDASGRLQKMQGAPSTEMLNQILGPR